MNDREKKILYVALVLQILTNMAIVMTDELAPGSITFLAWSDVLHLAGEWLLLIILPPRYALRIS